MVVSENNRSDVAYVTADAYANWETMRTRAQRRRCHQLPRSWQGRRFRSRQSANLCQSPALSAVGAAWETMPIPLDRAHIPGAEVTVVPMVLTGRRRRSCSNRSAFLILVVTVVSLSLCGFTLAMVFRSSHTYFKTGVGCDVS